jgi:hypothetical protein
MMAVEVRVLRRRCIEMAVVKRNGHGVHLEACLEFEGAGLIGAVLVGDLRWILAPLK